MASSFYTDGLEDAKEGRKPSPPDAHRNGKGQSTNVCRDEYMEGYRAELLRIKTALRVNAYRAGFSQDDVDSVLSQTE